MSKKWDWGHEGLFFLSKTPVVEITSIGAGYDNVDFYHPNSLYMLADQRVGGTPVPDRWGRNEIDQCFLALCARLYALVTCVDGIVFKSLSARQDGDLYLARLRYNNVDVELTIDEMLDYVTKNGLTW